jgi:hypothetical protein
MKVRTFAAASLIALVLASQAGAGESTASGKPAFVPARFAGGLDAASDKIRFPDYERDVSVYINCAARLSVTGEVERYFCLDYYGLRDTKFRQAAEAFIESAELTPALVDGEPRPVEVHFRVFFGRKGDLYGAGVFPNWGDDADKYGLEYEAPQRYNEDPPAPKCGSVAGISRVKVGTDGRAAGDVDLVMSYGVPEHIGTCESWMMQVVTDGHYIPAQHDGKPVAATYVELRGDPEWFTLKAPEGL